MLRNHTGFRKWQLRGDQGINPSWAANSQLFFDLKSLPLLTDGNKANYLAGILLSFQGALSITTGYGADVAYPETALTRALISSVQLIGAWHGRPLSQDAIRGATLPLIEFVSCGYRYATRKRPAISVEAVATNRFIHNVFLPLGFFLGRKPHHTMQLAALYKDAQLQINTGPNATALLGGTAVGEFRNSAGTAATTPNVRATAILLADTELRLGPATEWVEYLQPSASGAATEVIELDSFGNRTALSGVEPGAGIAYAAMLAGESATNNAAATGQLGSLNLNGVTGAEVIAVEVPWRGQTQTQHIAPFMAEAEEAVAGAGGRHFPLGKTDITTDTGEPISDRDGYPWIDNWARQVASSNYGSPILGSRVLPLVTPFADLEASKLQVVEGTTNQTVQATFVNTGGCQHRTLVNQWKSWTPAAMEDAKRLIIDSGLALKLLGTNNVAWSTKTLQKNAAAMDIRKARFFAQRLISV
jgi:hypothetical protein